MTTSVWKIGAFCGGFVCQNPLDFIEFFAAEEETFFHWGPLEHRAEGSGKAPCSVMLSLPRCTHHKEMQLQEQVFFHALFALISPLDFASLRFVVWLFGP